MAATRVLIEGGRMRDVKDAAHPTGTTFTVRDLFFNVPARRKFLRSEATESFHLTNLVTHYALAHPEIAFTLTNNGRETLRASPAADLRERAYQIFGTDFLDNLLEVDGGLAQVARVRGYVSAPRERRTSRDAQYLFINGRYVRDRLIGRALSEGYRSILPLGVYPAALLFLEVPLEEVDVNVHPAKTEVRFRRAAAVADAVREAVRQALASAGYARGIEAVYETVSPSRDESKNNESRTFDSSEVASQLKTATDAEAASFTESSLSQVTRELVPPARQGSIEFGFTPPEDEESLSEDLTRPLSSKADTARGLDAIMRHAQSASPESETVAESAAGTLLQFKTEGTQASAPLINEGSSEEKQARTTARSGSALPPIASAANLV
ncbi:MAG TPA: DNA mismatch repair endonuclease MutL, partial [Pyrinomonadaceae bacterium]|nr:DNA mismatch repair endonuclease MutL [Pyrinomonadaceae bacterium]